MTRPPPRSGFLLHESIIFEIRWFLGTLGNSEGVLGALVLLHFYEGVRQVDLTLGFHLVLNLLSIGRMHIILPLFRMLLYHSFGPQAPF